MSGRERERARVRVRESCPHHDTAKKAESSKKRKKRHLKILKMNKTGRFFKHNETSKKYLKASVRYRKRFVGS